MTRIQHSTILVYFLILSATVWGQKIYLYGGEQRDLMIGCINCHELEASSIWNLQGDFGDAASDLSIWNPSGTYGSEDSEYSPWNSQAAFPPIAKDEDGNELGIFTVDYNAEPWAEFDLALILYDYYPAIRKNISKWYNKLFQL
ncbi:hypothetical protein [Croceiramulus getboli]|nr:hypothetical protein P8624_11035 [Flavobacteriaceae bacterium YJPT1-3]